MSLLSLLAQQVAQKQQAPQMGQAQGQPLPFSGPPPQMPPMPSPDSLPRAPGASTFAPDATNAHQPPPTKDHPHWWGRLILGQGEFAPGTFLGTAADIAPPTMGLRAGASMAASHSGMGDLLAALPLIPGGGEAAAPVEGLVHDIAPAAKDEVASVMAQQAQREGHLPWGRSTSALEKIRPEDEMSAFDLFKKQGASSMPPRGVPDITEEMALKMTPDQIRAAAIAERAASKGDLIAALGEDKAKLWRQAEAKSNSISATHAEVQAADKTLQEMEAELTQAQRERIYGRQLRPGERPAMGHEELGVTAAAANNVHPGNLADRSNDDLLASFNRVMNGNRANDVGTQYLAHGYFNELQRRGVEANDVFKSVLTDAVHNRRMTPSDAADFMRSRIKAMQLRGGGTEATTPSLLAVPPKALPSY